MYLLYNRGHSWLLKEDTLNELEVPSYPTRYSLPWTLGNHIGKDHVTTFLHTDPQNVQPHEDVLTCPAIMPSEE